MRSIGPQLQFKDLLLNHPRTGSIFVTRLNQRTVVIHKDNAMILVRHRLIERKPQLGLTTNGSHKLVIRTKRIREMRTIRQQEPLKTSPIIEVLGNLQLPNPVVLRGHLKHTLAAPRLLDGQNLLE